ncbi:hypothetical protein M407DRAFT_84406 [Tulasnella calospora MUT 4182]|uniref:DDE Tnp4 domain-containing protein n=1 Tax=Tulasnella calospora MUT 4182 TaxID=1051891 RepID=A0A0C3L967_9AGAM|nr:hypothetical protein M407DRAFT_84406 [Tulasnella calospora MUT 4182]
MVLDLYKSDNPRAFWQNLRVLPSTFDAVLEKIRQNLVFSSPGSLWPQLPVNFQLAITLYHLWRNGNGASVESIGQWAGVLAGCVVKSTWWVMQAVLDLRDNIMSDVTVWEKEDAKKTVEKLSCKGWRDGWCMVDGTTIPLEWKLGLYGEGYFDRRSSYSLNLQLIGLPNLRIIDYEIGHCGSAHDSTCFKDTKTS